MHAIKQRQQQKCPTPAKVAAAAGIVVGGIMLAVSAAETTPTSPSAATTAPTQTSQSATPADFSSPKAAATTLFLALLHGDRAVVARALYAADDGQRALADAMADLLINGKRLGDAARARYGKDADAIGRGMLDPADLARVRDAAVKQSGDTAVMEVPGQSRPMSFRRRDGKWGLVVTDFGGAAPENIARQTRLVKMMADSMDESAREVASGKFPTPDAATAAIQKRLHEVMLNFTRPATTRAATTAATSAP